MSFAVFCGDLILEVPASKSRIQDWFRRPSNIEKCLKNLELISQPLDQNFYEKYDSKITPEQDLMLYCNWNRTDLESRKSRTSEGQQIIRDLRSEVMQLKASTIPPNLTRNFEAGSSEPILSSADVVQSILDFDVA